MENLIASTLCIHSLRFVLDLWWPLWSHLFTNLMYFCYYIRQMLIKLYILNGIPNESFCFKEYTGTWVKSMPQFEIELWLFNHFLKIINHVRRLSFTSPWVGTGHFKAALTHLHQAMYPFHIVSTLSKVVRLLEVWPNSGCHPYTLLPPPPPSSRTGF